MESGAAREAAEALRGTDGAPIDVGLVLGSGWSGALDALGARVGTRIPMADLPGFAPPGAPGHPAEVWLTTVGRRRVAIFAGRTHFYEHRDVDAVGHAVRVLAAAGARGVVLTNAAGSVRPEWPAGSAVLIADHLNLTGTSPLRGPRFVDLTDAYSPALRALAREFRPDLPEGVYAQFAGPQYETPAEVAMARTLGADLVGMSTALETVVARSLGLEVLGISLVTNLAAGVGTGPVAHAEVLRAGAAAADALGGLLAQVVAAWPT
ncbi:MAG: purine-nucleoside phosphorylase [Sporichthyaceae bacterium]